MRTDALGALLRFATSAALLLAMASPAAAGLCGDTSGDGWFTATDAARTLKIAVGTAAYDRRGDVTPLAPGGGTTGAGDGTIKASDALESLRASVEKRIPPCQGSGVAEVVVTTAPFDFDGVGGLAVVDPAPPHAFHFRGGSISADAVIRTPRGIPVVVNREGFNTLQIFDTADPELPNINECSVRGGLNSNPQDVVLLSDTKGYVTPYASPDLYVISPPVLFQPDLDPSCESIITSRIDLSTYDSDGIPQMDQMVVVDGELFVSLQLLDDSIDLPPKQNGLIAVIDTGTDTVTGTIPLSFENPFAQTKGLIYDEFQKRIFVGGPGNTGDILDDGGLEAVDPVTKTSDGLLLTGADLHANLFDFVIVGTDRALAIVADDTSNSVVDIDLSSRSIRKVLLTSTFLVTDIEMTEFGELWVAYRGETAEDPSGLRIFRVSNTPAGNDQSNDDPEITAEPIALGQAPFTLTFTK